MNGAVDPRQLFAQALQLHQAGRLQEAETLYRRILADQAGHADTALCLGVLCFQTGRVETAIELYNTVLRTKPDYAEAHSNLAAALNSLGRFEEAAAAATIAVRLRPDFFDAQNNLGIILNNLRRFEEAASAFQAAIRLNPVRADAHSNLGAALEKMGRFAEAVLAYQAAIRLNQEFAAAHYNLAVSLAELGRFDDALAALATATRLEADLGEAHYLESVIHLLRGDFARGWPQYEWRWRGGFRELVPRRFQQPLWQGQDATGRMILLHAEQGLGDAILFARYAALVAARGARVILAAPRPLLRLFAGLSGVEKLIAFDDPSPPIDFHRPLLSLPALFGTTLATIPADIPYLRAEPAAVEKWRARIGTGGFRIGIAWQGTPNVTVDRGRSVPLVHFTQLAKIPGVRLISLQKGAGLEQLNSLPAGMAVETLGEDFDSGPDAFIDTAGAMMALDLIVTSDTSICHLAGALGRPVWVPLKTVPHWTFLLNCQDSPWYPSMRLFRQTELGNWNGVFADMAAALASETEKA